MADLSTDEPVGKSLDEIAAMMTQGRAEMVEKAAEKEAGRKPGNQTQLGKDDEPQLDDDEEDVVVDDISEEVKEETGSEEADDKGEEPVELDEFLFEDTDLVEIDGMDDPVSFGDLKSAYTADKTIVATLNETKAYNQEASQARAKSQEDARLVSEAMTGLVQQVDTLISQPLVDPPNDALKSSDPGEYIRQGELYQQDQKRISDSRTAVTTSLADFAKQQKEFKETRRAHELSLLADVIPDLKVEGKREAVSLDIVEAAKRYGFSKEEVTDAIDHRIYQMAYDAAQYHKIMANGKLDTKGEKQDEARTNMNKQPRVLRSRGTSARQVSKSSAKRLKIVRNKALASGRPADVAEFMAQNRQPT